MANTRSQAVAFRVTPDEKKRLKKLAGADRRSVAWFIRQQLCRLKILEDV